MKSTSWFTPLVDQAPLDATCVPYVAAPRPRRGRTAAVPWCPGPSQQIGRFSMSDRLAPRPAPAAPRPSAPPLNAPLHPVRGLPPPDHYVQQYCARRLSRTLHAPSTQVQTSELHRLSPKQPSPKQRRDWYPYYAGFTEQFVEEIIEQYLHGRTFVLDPWSGSGTSGATCIRHGLAATGIDINPALTVIARARLNPHSSRGTLTDLSRQVIAAAHGAAPRHRPSDMLARWISPASVAHIRALQSAIHAVLNEPTPPAHGHDLGVDGLSPQAHFLYTALFGLVRTLLARYVPTNPMWLKYPSSYRHRVRPAPKAVHTEFRRQVNFLRDRLSLSAGQALAASSFRTGNATRLPHPDNLFDGAVTSPPYATRVDYVRGTLPELAVLHADEAYVERLRATITGTITVKGSSPSLPCTLTSPYARRLLAAIGSHSSKASRSYYLPWMSNYLHSLQAGLREVHRTVKAHCPICIVVQDSYYKEIRVDMQQIVVDMLAASGRRVARRFDYDAPNPRRRSVLLSAVSGDISANVETLLVFS